MDKRKKDQSISKIEDQVVPLLESLGIRILELSAAQIKKRFQVRTVLFKERGLSMDDCSEAHRLIFSRLEIIFPEKDVYLETASPGINRELKSSDELEVFIGKTIRVLREDNNEWIEGVLVSFENDEIKLKTEENNMSMSVKNIRKAKLSDAKEIK